MELKGRIVQILGLQTGEGRNGTWKKQEYVMETTTAQFPKKVCFQVWGEKIDQFGLSVGDDVTASIDIESREFNGKWYTNIQVWKIDRSGATAAAPRAGSVPHEQQVPDFIANSDDTDDLPF